MAAHSFFHKVKSILKLHVYLAYKGAYEGLEVENKKLKKDEEEWELFSHKADMGIRGIGPTFDKAFEQAGLALTGVMIDPAQVHEIKHIKVTCRAPNRDALFYDWINELIFQMSTLNMIFSRYKVTILNEKNEFSLVGEAWGGED